MKNKYPGNCVYCGRKVLPGEGHLEKLSFREESKIPFQLVHDKCGANLRNQVPRYY